METTRRGLLGGLLSGLGSLCLDRDEKPLIHTDQFFDTIRGLPCVPVDQWFNRMKPHLWEYRDNNKPFDHQYVVWNRLHYLYRDQIPIYFPEKALAEAVTKLPPKFGVYDSSYSLRPLSEHGWANMEQSVVPLMFLTNPRIKPHKDGRWLVIDVICGKEELPRELKHLTQYRTNEVIEYLTAIYPADQDRKNFPWPDYWGVSGMSCDFWPVCDGKCELEADGLRIKEIRSILNFAFFAVRPFCEPCRLSHVWMGDNRDKITDWMGIQKACDHFSDPYNPILRQVPRELLGHQWWRGVVKP